MTVSSASLPATRVQFGLGAVLPARNASRSDAGGQYSDTPSLRAAGFEDEDSLPDEAYGL